MYKSFIQENTTQQKNEDKNDNIRRNDVVQANLSNDEEAAEKNKNYEILSTPRESAKTQSFIDVVDVAQSSNEGSNFKF